MGNKGGRKHLKRLAATKKMKIPRKSMDRRTQART